MEHGFSQLSLGLEYSSARFDLFGSYYWQTGETQEIGSPTIYTYSDGSTATGRTLQFLVQGPEFNIGTSWSRWFGSNCFDLYISAGLYQYNYKDSSSIAFAGQIYQAQLKYYDLASVKVVYTKDNMFNEKIQAIIQLNISFDECGIVCGFKNQCISICNGITGSAPQRNGVIIRAKPSCCWTLN